MKKSAKIVEPTPSKAPVPSPMPSPSNFQYRPIPAPTPSEITINEEDLKQLQGIFGLNKNPIIGTPKQMEPSLPNIFPIKQRTFKVINTYPGSPFEIGDILYTYFFKSSGTGAYVYVTNQESPLEGNNAKPSNVETMPHLFEEITQ